jgi:hypothetical protein
LSAGLFRFGGVLVALGCASVEVERFASCSVVSGVETGALGRLPTTGLRPAHPAATTAHAMHAKGKINLSAERFGPMKNAGTACERRNLK